MDASRRARELRDATRLALIPLGVAAAFGLLLTPRWSGALPESIPVPVANAAELARTQASDRELSDSARREPLPGAVRALGSATRGYHTLEVQVQAQAAGAGPSQLSEARRKVDDALIDALQGGDGPLLALRATQLEGFVAEVQRFERTGEESPELVALAGPFVRAMTAEGWCEGHDLAPPEAALRTLYKQMWNGFLGFDRRPGFEPTLDEMRALYAFYLGQHHISRGMREALAAARRGAHDAKACTAIDEAAHVGAESWRLDHVKAIAAIDPAYPADYALGVASFGHGDYAAAVAAFRRWLHDHPEGPLALRAQNYLRAAAVADRAD